MSCADAGCFLAPAAAPVGLRGPPPPALAASPPALLLRPAEPLTSRPAPAASAASRRGVAQQAPAGAARAALAGLAAASSLGVAARRRSRRRLARVAAEQVSGARPPVVEVRHASAGAERTLAEEVHADFPALDKKHHEGTPLIYLDSAATAQKPSAVLDAIGHYYGSAANVHRGSYVLAAQATEEYEGARASVAKLIGASSPQEIVFTSGATEAINLVAQSWGSANLRPGDEIVTTAMEHHSNLVPWQLAAQRTGAVVKFARFSPETGELDLDHMRSLITPRTKLVAMAHVSNSLGCINPVKEVGAAAHAVGAVFLLDACQSVPHMPIDVKALGVDFLAASGHKMYGPTGIGFLWGKKAILDSMPPWKGGGEMIKEVTLEGSTWADAPARFEAGTPPIAQAVGLGAACEYLMRLGMERVQAYETQLARHLWDSMSAIPGLKLYGPPPERGRVALVAFNDASGGDEEVYPADIAMLADQDGFAIRTGFHCAQPVHKALGAKFGSARVSLGMYNTFDDIDRFTKSLRANLEMLREGEGCMFDPENPDACYCSSDRVRS